ncbi:tRNA lysidine(34) synthetase TilS [Algibacter sp. PT7-4]|uniref:tRNA lysidine(34) synthetase TilS n=1 Tax=Algibacter ulvanivorans TaxID=3400999 RepID=UPI003AAFBD82
MLQHFKNHITQNLVFLKENKILIAISGGIDSVVLTHLCHKLKFNIFLAHCNFNLRGAESNADEDFVVQFAESLGLEVFIQNFDTTTYAKENKLSIQVAARELRYNWFNDLAKQLQFNYILTAHHADDNIETFLINFTRGTGLEGLTGIPEINGKFVRPLLPFSSSNIETYAKENAIKWRDDSSNKSVKYLRNKLRHEVIPILKSINPSLLQSFNTTINNLKDASYVIEEHTNTILKKASKINDDKTIAFKTSEFKKLRHPKAYLFQVFKPYGFTEWNDVVNLLEAETGKQVFSKTHRLIKNRDHLILAEINFDTNKTVNVLEFKNEVKTPFGTLFLNHVNTVVAGQNNTIFVDKAKLKYPLTIRKYKTADVFYPLGMQGKKKISKYFKDEKLSLIDKENTWLLCSENKIVWVINKRADSRFKVTKNTTEIIKIELK